MRGRTYAYTSIGRDSPCLNARCTALIHAQYARGSISNHDASWLMHVQLRHSCVSSAAEPPGKSPDSTRTVSVSSGQQYVTVSKRGNSSSQSYRLETIHRIVQKLRGAALRALHLVTHVYRSLVLRRTVDNGDSNSKETSETNRCCRVDRRSS